MTPAELLDHADGAGLTVTTEDDRLVIRGPRTAEPLARALLDRKTEVLAHLAQRPGPGHWIAASLALGRPVAVTEHYPHICRTRVTGVMTGQPVRPERRDCAACQQERHR